MTDELLSLWAQEATHLLETERHRTEELMSRMQQSVISSMPNDSSPKPSDLINRVSNPFQ